MIKIYNSLSREVEEFEPQKLQHVKMYTCGPTVYDFAHIGNFRTYMTADLLIRTLHLNGYSVKYIMNLTDVGHLTGDNLGDADSGEDRMEKSAKKEGKTAWEVAEFYTESFLNDYEALNLTQPEKFVKATDHLKAQIDLIKELENKGYTYQTSDGIYFDTTHFPEYGKLSNLDQIKEGARVEINEEKRNPRDFALWKFSYPNGQSREDFVRGKAVDELPEKRQMEWKSPWGLGFPGWHIECSAMSMEYLGETLDIHAGGIDLRETHHPNEIAQSEAATGKTFANYWVHSAFMLVNGQRMSKSLKNNYKIYDLEKEGFEPLAVRYLYMQTHYRQEMNFTLASLDAAQNALNHLRSAAAELEEPKGIALGFEDRFKQALANDLNMPEALSIVWEMLKSDQPSSSKAQTLFKMDKVMGFGLEEYTQQQAKKRAVQVPSEVNLLVQERNELRKQRQFAQADQIRNKIKKLGYDVVDTAKGKAEVRKI